MAKIASQTISIKINKMVRDSDSDELHVVDSEMSDIIAQAVEQLIEDESLIVEVE